MITSNRFLKAVLCLAVAGSFYACKNNTKPKETNSAPSQKPNIVFILSDDHGYQAISAYGYGLNHTPHLDSLASDGMLFKRAFVNNSLCAPSRASIISGKYSNKSSVARIGDVFDGSQTTFPKALQNAGYSTALFGKWHLYSKPTGFDYWEIVPGQGEYYKPIFYNSKGDTVVEKGYITNVITDKALNWLEKRDTTKPFSLLIWNKAPHRDWVPEVKYLHLFDSVQIPEPETLFDNYATRTRAAHEQKMEISKWLSPSYDLKEVMYPDGTHRYDGYWKNVFSRLTPEQQDAFVAAYKAKNEAFRAANLKGKDLVRWKYQRFMKDYLRTVQSIDDNVGRVMDYLKAHGLDKNTIIVYSSDQGFYLGEHGWFDKRFMYRESFRTPLIVHWPEHIKPGSVSMASVMNLDIGPTLIDAAGGTVPEDMQGESFLPILEGETPDNWRKYTYYHYYASGGEHNVAKHIGVRSEDYKLIYFYENNEWELYDLQKNPEETQNIYGDPAYKAIQDTMLEALKAQMKKYDDHVDLKLNDNKNA